MNTLAISILFYWPAINKSSGIIDVSELVSFLVVLWIRTKHHLMFWFAMLTLLFYLRIHILFFSFQTILVFIKILMIEVALSIHSHSLLLIVVIIEPHSKVFWLCLTCLIFTLYVYLAFLLWWAHLTVFTKRSFISWNTFTIKIEIRE